jgi:uncharacterized membrane protein
MVRGGEGGSVRTLLAIVVSVLVAIGAAASMAYFHHPLFNPRFAEFPVLTRLHVVLGGLYLTLAPLQFLSGSRRRALGYHRWMGRILVAFGAVVGATATFIVIVIPGGGWPEPIAVGGFAVFFLVALGIGAYHIRAGRVALHREWMIRAFAIGLGIATQRIFFVIPRIVLIGHRAPTRDEIEMLMLGAFVVAFVVHAAVAEAWIRSGRSRRPIVESPSSYGPVATPT